MNEKDFQRIQELLTTNLSAVEGRINDRIDKLECEIKKVIQGRVLGFGWVCYAGVMARSCGRILVARQSPYGNEPSP